LRLTMPAAYHAVSRASSAPEEEGEQASLVGDGGAASALSAAAYAAEGKGGRQRLVLGLLGFMMEVICYADRTNISLAIIPMSEEQDYSEAKQGLILSSFFIGYCFTQILGGWASATYGGKPVLGCGVFFWSLATLLTPWAARSSLGTLIAVRIGMGVAEGISLPTMHQLTAAWIPCGEPHALMQCWHARRQHRAYNL
jgi:ACS family sodium-dependent inorganic phosphate cotransporter